MQASQATRIPAQQIEVSPRVDRRDALVRVAFRAFAILAGMIQAWTFRNSIATDGISYLDISDAILRGDWHAAINGYWSPLYPILLAAGRGISQVSPRYEFAVLHLVNFVIFLVALASFEFLLRAVLAHRRHTRGLPDWLLLLIGYSLFTWTSLELISVGVSSPDMAVAAFIFLSSGFLIRMAAQSCGWLGFAGLGLALGLGYLTKAVVFPIAFVFLAVAFVACGIRRAARPMLAAAVFLVVAGVFAVPLSLQKHRLTFGDTGKLNYSWYVDGAAYRHWQGQPLGGETGPAPKWTAAPVSTGVPAHATRKVLDTPPVYTFNGPVGGTYPVWFDPSYWNEGMAAPFDLRQQLRRIVINAKYLYSVLLNPHVIQLYREGRLGRFFSPLFLAVLLYLLYCSRKAGLGFRLLPDSWTLLVPAAAAIGLYSLVYSEPRHLAPFVVILYFGLTLAVRLPGNPAANRLATRATVGLVAAFVLTVGVSICRTAYAGTPEFRDWKVVEGLRQAGIPAGVRVATLEYANHANVKWVRLARSKVVAELYTTTFDPTENEFWNLDEIARARVLNAFATAGADIVVSTGVPNRIPPPLPWERIGDTSYSLYRVLRSPAR